MKKKTSNRVSVGPLKDGEKIVTDNKEMAEMLNNWYLSVFTRENLEQMPEAEQLFTGETPLISVKFTPNKVLEKLKELKPNAAPGPDGIWTKIISSMAEVICGPLALIYTKCIETGEVPPEWKTANVAPIFKKGSKSVPGNYRPVSLTCVLCKVMEKIICDAIIEHLKLYDLIRRSQHGFMRSKSTLTNLLAYLEDLTKIMDQGLALDVVYLDFSKAFDKVPIQRLLSKCSGLGIQGKLLEWIEKWLVGRKQRVVLNGEASSWGDICSGVVQGSCLGPVLFTIFINDIDGAVDIMNSILSKFADDTKWGRVVENEDDQKTFQEGLDSLMKWSQDWQMDFNVDKCHIMHIGQGNNEYKYTMGGKELQESEFEKDIGVIVQRNLRPSLQCAKAAKTANAILGQLSRAVTYRDKNTFLRLFRTYVRPHVDYCAPAYSPWTQGDKDILENVQRRAIGMVTNFKGRTYEEKLAEAGMVTLETRRLRGDLLQAYRVLHGVDDVDPSKWFTMAQERNGATSTRHTSGALNVERGEGRGEVRRNFWSQRVAEPWNNLPDEVKTAKSLNDFKNGIDNLRERSNGGQWRP